jgi:hypothetical protein
MRVFRKNILELDLDVKYYFNLDEIGIEDCDVLIFHDDHYRQRLPIEREDRQTAVNYLRNFFKKFSKVIWFDDSCGSGWLRSYIFPLVDTYVTDAIMKDLNYYKEQHPVGIIHRDYPKEKFGIQDPKVSKDPLDDKDISKLEVSWNRAFKNWHFLNKPILDRFFDLFFEKKYSIEYTPPSLVRRSKIIPYRMNYWRKKPTIEWWREQTLHYLQKVVNKTSTFTLNPPERISRRRFYKEMKKAVVTVSPFGLGEICYRDFEAFIHGSLLFKPNMDHINTYPDLYENGVTYIAHKWDFSDFEEKLEDVLTHPDRYEDVAHEGQKRFKEALSDGEKFSLHFFEMIS